MAATALILIGLALQSAPAAPPPAVPLIPAFFTAEALYDICNRPNAGQCSMYISGTLDGFFLMEAERERESFCLPQMTNRKAADAIVDYLDRHPDVRAKAASAAIYEAVTETYPCAAPETEAELGIEGA